MVGHLIAHTNNENEWLAKVLEVNGSDLRVSISSDYGDKWEETWNLADTQAGINNGEYYIVGKVQEDIK